MSKFYQGKYKPNNPQKYKGDLNNIIYRSGWELKFFRWCDTNPNVIKWAAEETIIPYINEIDQSKHRYFVDAYIEYRDKQGQIQKKLIEIKPYKQTQPPSKRSKRYREEMITYITNQSKWKYAKKFAERRGIGFMILTERQLGIK